MPPKRRGETSGGEPAKRRRWTPDEEAELQALVGELGPDKWPAVAQRLGTGRSAAAVELHWKGTAASAPSAAPKPAKRARKSTAKRAAKSAAKPMATLGSDSLAALPPPGAAKRAPPPRAARRAPPTAPPPGTRVAVRFDDKDYEGTVSDMLDETSATVKFDDGSEHPINFTEPGIRITREAPAAAPPPAAKPAAKAKPRAPPAAKAKPRAPPAAKKPQSKPAPRPPRAAPTPAAAPEKKPAAKKPRPAPTEDKPPAAHDVDALIARNAPIVRTEKPRSTQRAAAIEAATTAREYIDSGGKKQDLLYDLKSDYFRVGEAAPTEATQV